MKERSINILRHIGWSMLFKSGSIVSNFMMVPLALSYLGTEDYGIWLTLSSVLTLFMLLDIGLGNGLRNNFSKAIALGKHEEAQAYISTAYISITAISTGLVVSLWFFNYLIDWSIVFNTTSDKSKQFAALMPILFVFFGLQLIVKLIVSISQGDQNHSIQDKVQFFGQVLSLLSVWFLSKFYEKSLFTFSVFYSLIPLLVLVFFNIYLFTGRYKRYRPSINYYNRNYLKRIAGLGVKFFVIQIAAVILFSTDNFIITHLFGPAEVVPYNLAFKYFSVVAMCYSLLMAPYWSAFTEAYAKKDISWIRASVARIQKIWLLVPIVLLILAAKANWFYVFWVGVDVVVPQLMTLSMALYVLLLTFNMIYVQFINGVGKIKLQLIVSVIVIIVNVPLSIFLADYINLGSAGVIVAKSICLLIPMLLWRIQYIRLINGTATGIWNK